MKKYFTITLSVFCLMLLASCEAIETIFEAGMWWGIILVVLVIGIIFWLFGRGKN